MQKKTNNLNTGGTMLYFSETLDFLMGVQASMGRGQVFVGFGSAKNIFLKGKYQKNNLDLVNF